MARAEPEEAPVLWVSDFPETDERTVFLTGRWRGISAVAGRLVAVPVQHGPWPLRSATVSRLDETLVASCGLPAPEADPLVQWSPGVDVRFGPPRLL